MILSLLLQEFESSSPYRGKKRVLSLLLKTFVSLLFMVLLAYVFWNIDSKLRDFSSYGTYDFFVLYLFLAMVLSSLTALPSSLKSLERKEDRLILSPLPLSQDEKILAKGIYFYLKLVISSFVLTLPVLLPYGIARGFTAVYYSFSFLYPFLISIFALGLLSLFLGPYAYLMRILRRYRLFQFLIACIAVIGLCFLYREVLSLFLYVLDGAALDAYFSEPFLASLASASLYFVPISQYIGMLTGEGLFSSNFIFFLGLSILMLVVGFFLLSFLSNKLLAKEEKIHLQKDSLFAKGNKDIFFTLLKKEYILLFRNSSYLFSYTSLLIMQPFLGYVVIESLNRLLYQRMEMFLTYFPELINGVTLFLVLLFASLISGSAADGLTREGTGRIVMKEIPISPIKQMEAKLLVSTSVSILSLLFTDIVLLSFSLVNAALFFVILGIGLLFILSLNLLGAMDDLRRLSEKKKGGSSLLSLYSLLLPIFLAIYHFLLVFMGASALLLYGTEFLLFFLFFGALLLFFWRKLPNYFKSMRVDYI